MTVVSGSRSKRSRLLSFCRLQAILLRSSPDEFMAEAMGINLGAVGYVRVQVSPRDYESARDVIEGDERTRCEPEVPNP